MQSVSLLTRLVHVRCAVFRPHLGLDAVCELAYNGPTIYSRQHVYARSEACMLLHRLYSILAVT
jgi:hypothetical protein